MREDKSKTKHYTLGLTCIIHLKRYLKGIKLYYQGQDLVGKNSFLTGPVSSNT